MTPPAPDWSPLEAALDRAADAGRRVAFWWRDDDAVAATPALDRLLALAGRCAVPLALAPIPARVEPSLPPRLSGEPAVGVLVHGLWHENYAPPDQSKAEFGPHRPLPALIADAAEGLRLARERLGPDIHAVFAPPWNRVEPALISAFPDLGYQGLTIFGDRPAREAAPGLVQVNAHVDPIDWHGTRSLVDPQKLVAGLARMVERRLSGPAGEAEPIGLLTHHLKHDEAIWTFCAALLERLARHPAARFPALGTVFASSAEALN